MVTDLLYTSMMDSKTLTLSAEITSLLSMLVVTSVAHRLSEVFTPSSLQTKNAVSYFWDSVCHASISRWPYPAATIPIMTKSSWKQSRHRIISFLSVLPEQARPHKPCNSLCVNSWQKSLKFKSSKFKVQKFNPPPCLYKSCCWRDL